MKLESKGNYRAGNGNPCKECVGLGINCRDMKACSGLAGTFRHYGGIRLTADGFDCALPVTIDSHSHCSYECLYCFSDNIQGHATACPVLGRTGLSTIESLFSGPVDDSHLGHFRKAMRYDRRNKAGYPCPVQLGGLCDPCDNIERHSGWLLRFMALAIKYGQPVRMSTKGVVFLLDEYFDVIRQRPELFWVAFSIICNDDALMVKVDRGAPNTTMRFKAMARLAGVGVSVSLRLRPMIPGITDYRNGYVDLIKRAADAGAKAISYETMFYPAAIPSANKWKYAELKRVSKWDLEKIYKGFGRTMTCTRPPATFTEDIMHKVREVAHGCGLTVGVSDPVWKQLSDVGCCCGIKPTDPVFGNWEVENMTNAIVKARDGKNKLIHLKDIVPEWAYTTLLAGIAAPGVGPLVAHSSRYTTWAQKLADGWNNPSKQRSVMNYLQGAVVIDGKDAEGNYIYRYVGLKRKHMRSIW